VKANFASIEILHDLRPNTMQICNLIKPQTKVFFKCCAKM